MSRVHEVFDAVCDLPREEREAALTEHCGDDRELRREVEELLRSDENPLTALDRARPGLRAPSAGDPKRVGEYEILRLLGRGGMGVVYEAMQLKPHRKVALKLIRSRMMTADDVRRFEGEATVLGYLNHPGIATVYEAGTAEVDGERQPFLAMELITGFPLDRYVQESGLEVAERIELVARIADAVHHAHQRGVIHRDLKPANVLVDAAGQPKVLDFGIARITRSDRDARTRETAAGEILGTLPYMSPEQVQGDPAALDTRTDVYALGVVLYEILSGRKPHDVTGTQLVQAIDTIVREDPPALGTLDRNLRGDVEVIVQKAMEKETDRRYASAADLADDLRRYLADEPIRARPASTAYQIAKFARRNKLLVAGASSTLAALVLGLLGTVTFAVRASERSEDLARQKNVATLAAEQAELEARTSEEISDFLVGLFRGADPRDGGNASTTAKDLLDRGRTRIDALDGQPAIQARLLDQIGRSFLFLGFPTEAEALLLRSADLCEELYGPDSVEIAEPLHRLAKIYNDRGELERALEFNERVIAIHEAHQPGNDVKVAESHNNISLPLLALGRVEEALAHLHICLRLREAESPRDPVAIVTTHANIAANYGALSRMDDNLRHFAAAIEAANQLPVDHPVRLGCLTLFGSSIKKIGGRQGEAEELLESVLEQSLQAYGEMSTLHADILESLAYAKNYAGKIDEAIELEYEVLEVYRERKDDRAIARVLTQLGSDLCYEGRYRESEELLFESLELHRQIFPVNSNPFADTLSRVGVLMNRLERFEEAEDYLLQALAAAERVPSPEPSLQAAILARLGNHYERAGESERALETLSRALEASLRIRGEAHWNTAYVKEHMAEVHRKEGRFEEAERLLREAVQVHASGVTTASEQAITAAALGRLLQRDLGRPAEAEPHLRRSYDLRTEGYGAAEDRRIGVALDLAECLIELERPDEARDLLERHRARGGPGWVARDAPRWEAIAQRIGSDR